MEFECAHSRVCVCALAQVLLAWRSLFMSTIAFAFAPQSREARKSAHPANALPKAPIPSMMPIKTAKKAKRPTVPAFASTS
mmetsp:Transcript_31011/g.70952  ORF Transcript_31011/g.70952 Transcript_31011/m.70952 type:complete len:81 (-) Transcript_31011:538-780(-)